MLGKLKNKPNVFEFVSSVYLSNLALDIRRIVELSSFT